MDYGRPALADAIAAEYVLGTLRGGARRRFEALVPAHPQLRAAMLEWTALLTPLTTAIDAVEPSGDVWRRISDRIGNGRQLATQTGSSGDASVLGWWRRLAVWRSLAAFASIAAIALGVALTQREPVPPPIVVVLSATPAASGNAAAPALVASISGDRSMLVARAVSPVAMRSDRSLELWAVPKEGSPRSLGLLAEGNGTMALRGRIMAGVDTLAVTMEPPGGSPTRAPTGPIVYAGKFTL